MTQTGDADAPINDNPPPRLAQARGGAAGVTRAALRPEAPLLQSNSFSLYRPRSEGRTSIMAILDKSTFATLTLVSQAFHGKAVNTF
jgi:hypothetical protein